MSNEAATTSKALSSQRIRLLTSTAIFADVGTGNHHHQDDHHDSIHK